ncbi:ATP-dependent helicase, partial [Streptomyces althioticus]
MFEPGDPARTGRIAFWRPDGGTPPPTPGGEPGEAGLVVPDGDGFTVRTVPVVRLTPSCALPALLHARRATATPPADPPTPATTADAPETTPHHEATPHPATAFWGAVTALALHLTARERLLPGVSPAGYDTWRGGPFDADDIARIRALADAAPGEAVAVPGTDPDLLVRAF